MSILSSVLNNWKSTHCGTISPSLLNKDKQDLIKKRQHIMDRVVNGSTVKEALLETRISVYQSKMNGKHVIITDDDFFVVGNLDEFKRDKMSMYFDKNTKEALGFIYAYE